ncbi:hypothetical protein IHE49_00260 [Rhodanobacter sp. 7MK24]|uniref:hypothetical protein n=1 Tax=Rhodanobacter sp. 7MK24 TaxID=2775922 RepID=UPI00177C4CEC|nr:hypothetical protein [Rhodanobacter sp. 7MK24]MBD8878906.1 hypothetical protein [Rhodanobacter sp. 7MK24]
MRRDRLSPWLIAALLLVLWGGWSWWHMRPLHPGPGELAPDDPVQTALDTPMEPIHFGDFTLTPRAKFDLVARVLSTEHYRFDAGAALVPEDFAFGWGRMSDSAILKDIDISQSGRFYYWSVRQFPIPRREIETHSANMHLIPADVGVRRALGRIRVGQVVALDGFLVDADRAGGWHWRTSMTRDDTGDGACELFYVTTVDSPVDQTDPAPPSSE